MGVPNWATTELRRIKLPSGRLCGIGGSKQVTRVTGRQQLLRTNCTGYERHKIHRQLDQARRILGTGRQLLHSENKIIITSQILASTNIVTATTRSNCGKLARYSLQDAPNLADTSLARLCSGETTSDSKLNKSGNTDLLFTATNSVLRQQLLKKLFISLTLYRVVTRMSGLA
jgi:hypothetical protein